MQRHDNIKLSALQTVRRVDDDVQIFQAEVVQGLGEAWVGRGGSEFVAVRAFADYCFRTDAGRVR